VLVAIAAAAAFTVPGSPSSPHRAARDVPSPSPRPIPLGAPEVQGPDAGSTLLTSYAGFHDGFVYIYADGRVIYHSDWSSNAGDQEAWERRLNPRGLDLVRSGVLVAWDFIQGSGGRLLGGCATPPCPVPSDVWNHPYAPPTPWTPTEYAGCLKQEDRDLNLPPGYQGFPLRDATSRVGELPATAQALLHTRRMYLGAGLADPSECFALTPEERAAFSPFESVEWVELIPASTDEGAIGLSILEVMPHGAIFAWGG
jgi:hypothetical protein